MDLPGYLVVLRRRLLPLLLCVVAGLVGGVVAGTVPAAQYQATARTLVNLPTATAGVQESLAGAQLSGTFIQTYTSIATSRAVAERVVQQLSLGETPEDLQGRLSAAAVKGTFLIDITVQDRDPERAKTLADTAAVALGDTVAQLEQGKPNRVQAQLLDRASVPRERVSPRPRLSIAVGLVLGLITGVALAGLLEALDRTVKTTEQGEAAFGVPMLGLVPRRRSGSGASRLVVSDSASSVEAEPYRALRTAVQFLDPDVQVRTILVTSATPGDGKTTTAANLALALAAAGQAVAVVDGDLRRAGLAEVFGLEGQVGLGSVVRREVPLEDALQVWGDGVEVLPAGRPLPPNPSEILGSDVFAALIEQLTALVDVVVIDSPPVLPVTDAVALAAHVDAVVLVARYGGTLRAAAVETRRRLEAVGAPIAGFVLNAVPPRDAGGYYAEYGYGPGTAADPPRPPQPARDPGRERVGAG